jgi:hypothetical protein
VENLKDTLSVNHNWLNGYNMRGSWGKLSEEVEALRALSLREEKVEQEGEPAADAWVKDESEEAARRQQEQTVATTEGDFVLLYDVIAHQLGLERGLRPDELDTIEEVLGSMVESVGRGDLFGVKEKGEGGWWRGEELMEVVRRRRMLV